MLIALPVGISAQDQKLSTGEERKNTRATNHLKPQPIPAAAVEMRQLPQKHKAAGFSSQFIFQKQTRRGRILGAYTIRWGW